jgi:biopolymer transport protein ExbD
MLKILISFIIVLSSCSRPDVKLDIPVEKPKLALQKPPPVNLQPVIIKVIIQAGMSYFCMDSNSYESMAINFAEIKKHMAVSQEIIKQYEELLNQ